MAVDLTNEMVRCLEELGLSTSGNISRSATDYSPRTFKALEGRGLIDNLGSGVYCLSESGEVWFYKHTGKFADKEDEKYRIDCHLEEYNTLANNCLQFVPVYQTDGTLRRSLVIHGYAHDRVPFATLVPKTSDNQEFIVSLSIPMNYMTDNEFSVLCDALRALDRVLKDGAVQACIESVNDTRAHFEELHKEFGEKTE